MSEQQTPTLEGLATTSTASDYVKTGYHEEHTALPEQIQAIARLFRDAGYYLENETCEDYLADEGKLVVAYVFNRFGDADRHLILVDVPEGTEIPTLVPVFKAACWFEREIWDMFGLPFKDHPDMRRILLPLDADFHPLLKSFNGLEEGA